ncbi:hypothetical protein NT6N_20560 [Oceaniferula spumae]|uniref:Ice-binding protein C-terminal domain-containing protein n=1 Tax=Oceaniferula spumae TaxID=2979115 RepID=A0AAT9FLX6_9BACT
MKNQIFNSLAAATLLLSATCVASAATINLDVISPGPGNPGWNVLTSDNGNIAQSFSTSGNNRIITYDLTNVDLTSVGGTANETIQLTVSLTGTTGVAANPYLPNYGGDGAVGRDGGGLIYGSTNDTLTATVALVSSTFSGVTVDGFDEVSFGGFIASQNESANIIHEGGTTLASSPSGNTYTLPPSSFMTIDAISGAFNLVAYEIQLTAVPEPSSTALLGLGGLALIMRRRR